MESVKILLEAGADINLVDSRSESSFEKAARAGRGPVIEHMLANTDFRLDLSSSVFGEGQNVLHVAAAKCFHKSVEVILRKRAADLNRGDSSGRTPLMLAAANGCLEVVKALVSMGSAVDVNAKDACNQTALHAACRSNKNGDQIGRLLFQRDDIR